MGAVPPPGSVVLLTGIMASGKSTVAQALAERLPRSAHVRGDVFRRFVVNGAAPPTPEPSDEAMSQLRLRYRLAAHTADAYAAAGFTAVVQDIVLGPPLTELVGAIRTRPRYVVMLAPRADVVEAREAGRGKTGYSDGWRAADLDHALRADTPRHGLWLDTSDLPVDETVDTILRHLDDARVD